jgi:hypothetical protein
MGFALTRRLLAACTTPLVFAATVSRNPASSGPPASSYPIG